MNLHLNKNLNKLQFPMIRCARSRPALLVATVAVLFVFMTNCRGSRKTENIQAKPMTNSSDSPSAASDPLSIPRRAIILDMHADTTQRLVDENVDLEQRLPDGHLDAVRAREGGLDAQFFSIWVEPELFGGGGPRAIARADKQIEAVRALAEKHPETWQPGTSAADIRRGAAAAKMALLL